MIVYDEPSIQGKQISVLQVGNLVRKINENVIEVDGYTWDKVKLSNGIEGYTFSKNLELEKDYNNIAFLYDGRKYDVYFNPLQYNVNLKEYKYFLVGVDEETSYVSILYSKEPIIANSTTDNCYYNYGSKSAFKIAINNNGIVLESIFDMTEGVKIEHSKYISSNRDIYYNNLKVFSSCIYDDEGKIAFTTDSSWDNIKINEGAYSGIWQGEREYNSMTENERLVKHQILIESYEALYLAAIAAKNEYPNAANALIYFLTSGESGKTDDTCIYENNIFLEGHTMRKISLENAINENSIMKKKLEEIVVKIKEVAEKFNISENESVTFYNISEASAGTGSYSEMSDWFLLLGHYRIKVQALVTRKNNNYKIEMRYGIVDYYDWKEKENDKSYIEMLGTMQFKGILFKTLESMHRAGMARNYTNYGEISYKIT